MTDILRDSEVLLYSRRSTQRNTGQKGYVREKSSPRPTPPPLPFLVSALVVTFLRCSVNSTNGENSHSYDVLFFVDCYFV